MDWEMIGNIRLNYTYYTGEDIYSDGPVEDSLLELCQQDQVEEALTCIELSRKRSQINAWKNKECDNVEIYVGKYEDIQLDEQFDYITLIGVLEYAGSYTTGDNPYQGLLEQIRSMLKPDGKILIAIENRMGLKYLNGAKEDHSRNLFEGVHGYPSGNHVRTFTRPELSALLSSAELPYHKFYYPMPDYKMPSMILSDEYRVNQGTFHGMSTSYDAPRVCFFQEDLVWNTLAKDGEFGYFANSFFVEAGMADDLSDILYVKYSRLRKKEFQTRILIGRNAEGRETAVYKYALNQEGMEHITSHVWKGEALEKVFRNLSVVGSTLTEDGGVVSPYIPGSTVSDILFQHRHNREQLIDAINRYLDQILDFPEEYMRTSPHAPVFSLDVYQKDILHLDTICHTVADYNGMYQKSLDFESLERKLEMHKKNEERLRKRIM